jgi:hypothetical protein
VEAVTEGEGPPTPGEDGVAARAEDDVHRLDLLWPSLLHQYNLSNREAGGGDRPPDYFRQPEGGEAAVLDDDEELQEVGPPRDEGSQGRCCQAAGSRDHAGREGCCLQHHRGVFNWGKGAQNGPCLPERPVNAPYGAGSRHCCHQW